GGKGMKIEKYVVPFCKRLMACGNCIDTNNHRAFSRFRIYLHEKYGLVIPLALKFPHRQIVGYELSIMPWLTAVLVKNLLRLKNLEIYRQDFLKSDWSGASVIVCYLFPGGMDSINNKLESEKSDIGFVISNNFALPSYQPDKIIRLNDFYNSPIYLYKIRNLDVQG
ncbi:hypothetical protein, partial [Pontibacterium sp.]|uniref:hypothetical protein n=1 Tax=Pontibacterium sp. TaxID=2036026 RepID=UPI0035123BA4